MTLRPGEMIVDNFAGGGGASTGLVADRLRRNAILCELNPAYAEIARKRIEGDGGLLASVTIEPASGLAGDAGLSPGRRSIEGAEATDRAGSPASVDALRQGETQPC